MLTVVEIEAWRHANAIIDSMTTLNKPYRRFRSLQSQLGPIVLTGVTKRLSR